MCVCVCVSHLYVCLHEYVFLYLCVCVCVWVCSGRGCEEFVLGLALAAREQAGRRLIHTEPVGAAPVPEPRAGRGWKEGWREGGRQAWGRRPGPRSDSHVAGLLLPGRGPLAGLAGLGRPEGSCGSTRPDTQRGPRNTHTHRPTHAQTHTSIWIQAVSHRHAHICKYSSVHTNTQQLHKTTASVAVSELLIKVVHLHTIWAI